jgi:hypothetical protein
MNAARGFVETIWPSGRHFSARVPRIVDLLDLLISGLEQKQALQLHSVRHCARDARGCRCVRPLGRQGGARMIVSRAAFRNSNKIHRER